MNKHPETIFLSQDDYKLFSNVERKAFEFCHNLQKSCLMSIDALRDLSRFIQENKFPFLLRNDRRNGLERMSGWGDDPENLTLVESFGQLDTGNILIMLKSVQRHPAYSLLLQDLLNEIGEILKVDMKKKYRRPVCTIIIASPHRVTPYHVDDSHNFLMQVRGHKDFYVFDGTDPEIVTADEREAFWNGNANPAHLTDAKQAKATTYALEPGRGVHVPFLYPHWAKNGTDVSVAVSINFQSVSDRTLSVHNFNDFLRSKGLHPSAPGHSKLVDYSKVLAFEVLSVLRDLRNHSNAAQAS